MKATFITAALLGCLVTPGVRGQDFIDPKIPINKLKMDQWTSDDGLSSTNLTSVYQDRSGFLWITSYNGLSKFDGATFEHFDKENLPFLNSSAFYQTREDSLGNLWFATQGSGVIRYRDGEFFHYGKSNGLPNSIRCIFADPRGRIWAGTNQQGVFVMQWPDSVFRPVRVPPLQTATILDIREDALGRIWVATEGRGAAFFDDSDLQQLVVTAERSNQIVEKIWPAEDGRVYLGTDKGVHVFEDGHLEQLEFLYKHHVNDILIDAHNTVWVGTEIGLGRLNRALGIEEFISTGNGFPGRQIISMTMDREGGLWLTTEKNGLVRLRQGRFTNYSVEDGLSYDKINIIREWNGAMWVGTDDGRINKIEDGVISELPLVTPMEQLGIRDICFDQNGVMWIGSYKGLLRYDQGNEKLFGDADGIPSSSIRRIHLDRNNSLWIATKTHGVVVMDPDGSRRFYEAPEVLKANYVLSLAESADGTMYLGTHSGGLTLIHPNGTTQTVTIGEDPSGILIFNVYIDPGNTAWIVTNIGLYRLDGGEPSKVIFDPGLKNETFFDLVVDDLGNAWLSSAEGIIRTSMKQIEAQIMGKIPQVSIEVYDTRDGMLSKDCTAATPLILSSRGDIWISTFGGISVIDPGGVSPSRYIPPVYITSLTIDNHPQNLKEVIRVPPGSMRYNFDFTSLSFTAPDRVSFKYKLENFDVDWVETINVRQADYTNLGPGTYTFRVLGSNSDRYWNPKEASVTFEVEPHIYQTIWFYLLAGVGILLGFAGVYQWRVHEVSRRNRELEKLNNELDRFVYSASHDLRAPLASVLGLVSVAQDEKEIAGKDECLRMIENSVNKLDGFISDIIDYSRNSRATLEIERVDFESLIKETFEGLKYLDKGNRIEKRVHVNQTQEFKTDPRRLKVILNNLVSNAIRYHDLEREKPFLEVNAVCDGSYATLEVSDNGQGIEKRHQSQIFEMFYQASVNSTGSGLGLYIVRETVERLKGRISVISEPRKGTRFKVRLPSMN